MAGLLGYIKFKLGGWERLTNIPPLHEYQNQHSNRRDAAPEWVLKKSKDYHQRYIKNQPGFPDKKVKEYEGRYCRYEVHFYRTIDDEIERKIYRTLKSPLWKRAISRLRNRSSSKRSRRRRGGIISGIYSFVKSGFWFLVDLPFKPLYWINDRWWKKLPRKRQQNLMLGFLIGLLTAFLLLNFSEVTNFVGDIYESIQGIINNEDGGSKTLPFYL